jgi:hypothetical protein
VVVHPVENIVTGEVLPHPFGCGPRLLRELIVAGDILRDPEHTDPVAATPVVIVGDVPLPLEPSPT